MLTNLFFQSSVHRKRKKRDWNITSCSFIPILGRKGNFHDFGNALKKEKWRKNLCREKERKAKRGESWMKPKKKRERNEKKNCDKVKKKDKERGEIYLLQRSSTWLHLANTNRSPQILSFSFRTLSILPPEWQAIAWPRQKALSPLNPLSNKTPFAWGSMQLGYNPMIASMKTSVVMIHSEDNSNSFLS